MQKSDWEFVRAIYLEGISTGHATFETQAPTWEQWHAAHLPFGRLVARESETLQGWAALSLVSSRRAYCGVAEVSIYVSNKFRGRGVGRALQNALIEAAEQNNVWTLQASLFPENAASVALHKRAGFREVGRRERIAKLHGVWRDTLLLERRSEVVGTS